jgi:Domain of Unknown Function (DUF928)
MTSKLTTLFTSALALLSLQAFLSTSGPTALQAAFAGNAIKYQPPGRSTPKRTEGSGTRSADGVTCSGKSEKLFVAALSPTQHVGQTSSPRPTVYAYFSGSQALEVRLREIGKSPAVWSQTIQPKQPGLQAIAYPIDKPELVKGRDYEWSVTILCNPKSFERISSPFAGITRVDEPANLQEQLNKARTTTDRTQVYAEASLWYEALDTLAMAKTLNPKDTAVQTELINLLEQAGLKKTADRERATVQATAPQSKAPKYPISNCQGSGGDIYSGASRGDRKRCPS